MRSESAHEGRQNTTLSGGQPGGKGANSGIKLAKS